MCPRPKELMLLQQIVNPSYISEKLELSLSIP
jgi:hypothetical protein